MSENPLDKQAAALTTWKKPPTLAELQTDFKDAKNIHDSQVTKINGWLDNLNITGKAKPATVKGNSSIAPKLIRKQAEWRYAALSEPFLSTEDIFNVTPTTWEDREAAKQNQLVLNQQFNNKIDKTRFIDEYVRAAVNEGTVIVRVGWKFVEEEYEGEFPVVEYIINPEFAPMHDHLANMKQESPSQYDTDVPEELKIAHDMTIEQGQPIEPRITGYKKETRMRTLANHPTAEVCDFNNVVFDPTCNGDIKKASFAVYSFETSLAELKKDGKYKNLDSVVISTANVLSTPDIATSEGSKNFTFADDARKKIIVREYWGMRDIDDSGKVVAIVAAWVGETLIRMEENPLPDKSLPFVVEQYLPVRGSLYGEPDGALLEDNQKVIGAVTRGMIDIMAKSANGQTGIRKDMLDTTNRRKFDMGRDYEFNPNVDPRQGVYMHTYPEIPNSAQFMLQMENMEAESITGVKSFSGSGISGASLGDVAAGVRGALDAASKRELGILRRLSNGIIAIGNKFIAMNAEFLSDEEVVRITNDAFITVRKDALAGEFDLKLSISTAEEDNNKAEQLAFMLQTVGPKSDPALMKMILSDICRLRKMPDMAHKIEAYEPTPDPVAQKMQELAVAKLESEIAEIQAKTQKILVDAGLNQSKIDTEAAKQENLRSETDLKNLTFVEQESGVTQERGKELIGEQARSQATLAAVQHGFTEKTKREDRQHDLLKEYIAKKPK